MRFTILPPALLAFAMAALLATAEEPAPQIAKQSPATKPATVPANGTIHGQVTIAAGLDIQKPDLTRVVVYVASNPELDALPLPSGRPVVSQHNKTFVPNFTVVSRGTDVEFPNWDHFDHNVFSRSKAAPAFDLDRYPYGVSKSRQFDKLGIVQLFCNVHPNMRAIIFVTPNHYSARADADGKFQITGLPAGHYELVAWHERCEEQRKPFDVAVSSDADISFALEESRRSILANDPPERRAAYGVERGLGIKRERLDLPVVEESHPAPPPAKPEH